MYSNISLQGNAGQKEAETQADTLFTTHSIIEIKRVEQKMRLEIEQKKEDLRQMVGERYRDLIEAADSVIAMKEESLHVTQLLSNVQSSCQQLQQTHFLKGTGGQRTPPTLSSTQLLVLQMKLLVELQEEMRQRHDGGHLLSAALSYLLLRHIATHLTTTTDATPSSSSLIAMVTRLWKRVSSFKTTIVNSARSYLKSSQLDKKMTQDALCAIVLLEDISLSQAFVEFLSARKDAILNLFGPSRQAQSVKVTVQDLILAVYQTLQLTAELFSSNSGTGSTKLLTALLALSNSSEAPCRHLIPPSLLNILPGQICNYAAHLQGSMEDIPLSALSSQCQQWVTSCCTDVHPRLSEVLTHVKSLKALASVRDTAYQILSEGASSPVSLQTVRTKWTSICQESIGQPLSIYSSFVHPLLLEQAKAVIGELVTDSEDQLITALRELLVRHAAQPDEFAVDQDILSFLWEEERGDKGRQSMTSVLESLQLKAECCTPHVHQFCQTFDDNLKQLETDLHQFTRDKSSTSTPLASRAKLIIGDEFPFSRYADSHILQQHVSTRLAVTVDRFLAEIDVAVSTAVKELNKGGSNATGSPMNRVLLLARLCQNLSKFCPSLKQLVELDQDRPRYHTTVHSKTKTLTLATTSQSKLKLLLDQKGAELIRIWSVDCCQQFTAQLRQYLFSVDDLVHLSSSEVWEEIEIHEEAEGGRKVSTTIQIPCQASVYTQAMLYALTREISCIGGHNIDRNALVQLSRDVFDGALDSYVELLQCNSTTPVVLGQDCALQILFDVQFLSMIFSHGSSESSCSQKLSQVIDALHNCIDPFDLDVFSPLMAARLQRQLQRSSVMLGLLTGLKDAVLKRGAVGPSSTSSSYQEKPVILPLASVVPRIPLLPVPPTQHTTASQAKKLDHSDEPQNTNVLKFGGLQYLYM